METIRLFAIVVLLSLVFSANVTNAQGNRPEPRPEPVIGSVSTSTYFEFSAEEGSSTGMNPNLIGLGGSAEAIAGMQWQDYSWPWEFLSWIKGIATTKIHSGGPFNSCAQVLSVVKSGVNKGGSGRNCGLLYPGYSVSAEKNVSEDPTGYYWETSTWHEVARTGQYWAPILHVSQSF